MGKCQLRWYANRPPYQELGRAQHFNLRVPGYVLGIEKRIYKEDKTLLEGIQNAERPYEPRFIEPVAAGGEGKNAR